MRHFIFDVLSRHRWGTVFGALMLGGLWWMAGYYSAEAPSMVPMMFGASMGWIYMLGPTRVQFIARAVWHLPLSRRDIGRARWLVATVAATMVGVAAKLVAMLFPSVRAAFGFPGLLLSTVYDFAFAGLGYAAVIVASQRPPQHGQWRPVMNVVKGVAEAAGPLAFGAPIYLSTLFAGKIAQRVLPTQWSDIPPRGAVLLVLALGITIATYFHTPGPPLYARQLAPGRTDPLPAATRIDPGGLTGLPLLIARECGWTVLVSLGFAGASFLFAVIIHAPLALAVAYAVFLGSLSNRFPDLLGHLRVLPLSVRQINALLLLWPAFIGLAASTGYTLIRLTIGRGAPLHLDLVVGLVGLSAIAQALMIRMTGLSRLFTLTTFGGLVPVLHFLPLPGTGTLVLLGSAGFAAAAAFNHTMLRRSSTYHARRGLKLAQSV